MAALNYLSRWLHILSAMALAGGIFFLAVVVNPALRGDAQAGYPAGAEAIADRVRQRFKRLAHTAIGLLLLTGFYNYLGPTVQKLHRPEYEPLAAVYHPVMG